MNIGKYKEFQKFIKFKKFFIFPFYYDTRDLRRVTEL